MADEVVSVAEDVRLCGAGPCGVFVLSAFGMFLLDRLAQKRAGARQHTLVIASLRFGRGGRATIASQNRLYEPRHSMRPCGHGSRVLLPSHLEFLQLSVQPR